MPVPLNPKPPLWQGKPWLPEFTPGAPWKPTRRRCGACNTVWTDLDRPCPACATAKAKRKGAR